MRPVVSKICFNSAVGEEGGVLPKKLHVILIYQRLLIDAFPTAWNDTLYFLLRPLFSPISGHTIFL